MQYLLPSCPTASWVVSIVSSLLCVVPYTELNSEYDESDNNDMHVILVAWKQFSVCIRKDAEKVKFIWVSARQGGLFLTCTVEVGWGQAVGLRV